MTDLNEKVVQVILHEALNFAAMMSCKVDVSVHYDGCDYVDIVITKDKEKD